MEFEVVQGDITEQEADVLVSELPHNADHLSTIFDIYPQSVKEEVQKKHPEKPIKSYPIDTVAPGLDAEYIIHIRTINPSQGPNVTALSTRNVLSKVDDLGCTSVVFPIIYSTYEEVEPCAEMMFAEILDYQPENITEIRVIVPDEQSYETAKLVAEDVREEKKGQDT